MLNGFAKNPSAPAAMQASRTSDVLLELMIRTFDWVKWPLMNSNKRIPLAGEFLSGGICKSSIETSGL